MLYSEEAVRANLRNRDGKRVFYLGKGDQLTSAARDWLNRERIPILSPEQAKKESYRLLSGGTVAEKPEHMTHLNSEVLVPKDHPRIVFRGKIDTLEANLLLCGPQVKEVLELVRRILRCDVLGQPLEAVTLYGLDQQELRKRSHFPQDYYGIPHFMPDFSDSQQILRLNLARCAAREAELAAVTAFSDREGNPTRVDILQALNRVSSMLYILMIQEKRGVP